MGVSECASGLIDGTGVGQVELLGVVAAEVVLMGIRDSEGVWLAEAVENNTELGAG